MNRNIHKNPLQLNNQESSDDLLVELTSTERSKIILVDRLLIDKENSSNESKLIQVHEEHDQKDEILVYNRVITNDKQEKSFLHWNRFSSKDYDQLIEKSHQINEDDDESRFDYDQKVNSYNDRSTNKKQNN